jgi:hypothetical protein
MLYSLNAIDRLKDRQLNVADIGLKSHSDKICYKPSFITIHHQSPRIRQIDSSKTKNSISIHHSKSGAAFSRDLARHTMQPKNTSHA